MDRGIKKIGVLTSGGDAPGMNAAIRAVVRATIYYKKQSIGIYRGYDGLIDGEVQPLDARSVSNIIQRGGTMLKSARSKRFLTPEGRKQAYDVIKRNGIDALVVIGGNGTFEGAWTFFNEYQIPFIGIPGTIDNDIAGTDFTIGFDTACNKVVDAIDSIRDTASSHNRIFFIEVMGRHSGYLALRSAIGAGVEGVMIPENEMSIDQLMEMMENRKKQSSFLVVVAEGCKIGDANAIAQKVNERFPEYDTKVTVLGHTQRGGTPSCLDREIASRMGVAAVEGLRMEKNAVMVGVVGDKIVYVPFHEIDKTEKQINLDLFRINEILSV